MSETNNKGRPRAGRDPYPYLGFRSPPSLIEALDAFTVSHGQPFSRSEAIRAILVDWLAAHGFMKRHGHDHPEPIGPATEAMRAMDEAISEHKGKKQKA